MPIFAADYPFLDVFWTMLVFFFWVVWIWILITVLTDLFSRDDLGGWGKAAWALFVIVLPYLGVFIYLITQGGAMTERKAARIREAQDAIDSRIRTVAAGEGTAGNGAAQEIVQAKQLLDSGAIDQAEFDQLKRRALAA